MSHKDFRFSRWHYPAKESGLKQTKKVNRKPRKKKFNSLPSKEARRQQEIYLIATDQAQVVVKSKGRLRTVRNRRPKEQPTQEARERRYEIGKAMEGVSRDQELEMQAEFIRKHGITECPSRPCTNRKAIRPKNKRYLKGRMS